MEEFVFRPKTFYVKIDQFGQRHPFFLPHYSPKNKNDNG